MTLVDCRIVADLSVEESQFVRDQLDEFNEQLTRPRNFSEVKLALRSDSEELLGGLIGSIAWDWLHVHVLWIADSVRDKGHGKRLMQAAEEIARERSCGFVNLHTFEFQAVAFYEKMGYTIIGQTKGYPKGHTIPHVQRTLGRRAPHVL